DSRGQRYWFVAPGFISACKARSVISSAEDWRASDFVAGTAFGISHFFAADSITTRPAREAKFVRFSSMPVRSAPLTEMRLGDDPAPGPSSLLTPHACSSYSPSATQ